MALRLPVKGIYPGFGKNCYFAENATVIADIYVGIPARKIKKVDSEMGQVFDKIANNYIKYAK